MYVKKEFKRTSVYHIAIGSLVVLYLAKQVITLDRVHLIDTIPAFLLSFLFIYYGFKLIKANRKAVIALIILNVLQVISFELGSVSYRFVFGPFFQLDLMDWNLHSGFAASFWVSFQSGSYVNELLSVKVSLIPLAILIYLLDQLRFIPKQVEQPWEREFTDE